MSAVNPLGPTEAQVFEFMRLLHHVLRDHMKSDGRYPVAARLDNLTDMARMRLTKELLDTAEGGTLVALMDRAFRMDAATREFLALSESDFEDWNGSPQISDAALVRIMEKLLRLEPWTASGVPSCYAIDTGAPAPRLHLVKEGDQ